jgi:two-component system, OmpR family, phosphate regulon sensor histidine kinase PhoR
MNDALWIVAAALGLLVVAFLVLYVLGYRITVKKEPRDVHDLRFWKKGTLMPIQDPEPPGTEAIMALGKIEDGVMLVVEGDQVRYVNDAASRIFSVAADRCRGRTFIEVVRDYECDSLLRKCAVTGQLQVGVVRTHQKMQMLRVIIFPGAEKNSFVVTIQDLTDRSRLEEIRKDLVSNVAHEFRTPIASIKLLAETLIGGAYKDGAVSADFLNRIHTESEKLQDLTDDLNELWRLDVNASTLEKSPTDLGRLIRQTAERLQAQADRKGVAIKVNTDHDISRPTVDRGGIESVLMNLVYNAIRYTEPGGIVTVDVTALKNEVRVSVSDTGVGIPAEELPRIFERFYKVDKSRSSEGSGLGLSISKHVIAAHGGKIWAESKEGEGSTFFFTLPLNT